MRGNELIKDSAVGNTAKQTSQPENISVYKFGQATYIVQTEFNLDCKETFEDVINRLIMKEIAKKSA